MTDDTAAATRPRSAAPTSRGTRSRSRRSRAGSASTRPRGLTADEARQRLQEHGPNALAEAEPEPVWRQFLKHYRDYMQIVLVVAAVVSVLIGEYRTGIGLLLLTLFNAWLGLPPGGQGRGGRRVPGRR